MASLTTHVLDTAAGIPAADMSVTLFELSEHGARQISRAQTNSDGRLDQPLLAGDTMKKGRYRLIFGVADYFAARGVELAEPPFLGDVPLDFAIADTNAKYHVPLLVSPWSYSTYRGS